MKSGRFSNVGEKAVHEPTARISVKASSGPAIGPGEIRKTIGTGSDAHNSFVWVTIRWSFILGGLTSLAICLRPLYFPSAPETNFVEDLKSAWSIFMPVITLALGYALGKTSKSE